jgi:hypothetical protein
MFSDSDNKTVTMNKKCSACKLVATPNNTLVKCASDSCHVMIHDNCIPAGKIVQVSGKNCWYCAIHENQSEESITELTDDNAKASDVQEKNLLDFDHINVTPKVTIITNSQEEISSETEDEEQKGMDSVITNPPQLPPAFARKNMSKDIHNINSKRGAGHYETDPEKYDNLSKRNTTQFYSGNKFESTRRTHKTPKRETPDQSHSGNYTHIYNASHVKRHEVNSPHTFVNATVNRRQKSYGNSANEVSLSSQPKSRIRDIHTLTMLQEINKKLPKVTDKYETWTTFYLVYQETKDYFSDIANFQRVQEAVECMEIKVMGGASLRMLKTFEIALSNINAILSKNSPVKKEYEELIKFIDKHQMNNDVNLAEYLMRLLDFAIVATTHKETANIMSPNLDTLIKPFPRYLQTKCLNKLRDQNESIGSLVTLQDIILSEYQSCQDRVKLMDTKPEKPKNQSHKKNYNINNSDDSTPVVNNTTNVTPKQICWLHKNSNDHKTNKCRTLWNMSGEEAAKKAEERGICTTCSYKKHDVNYCTLIDKIKECNVCKGRHHALCCPKRKARKNVLNTTQCQEEELDAEHFEDSNEEPSDDCVNHMLSTSDNVTFTINHEITKKFFQSILGVVTINYNDVDINLLVDSGSNVSLLDKQKADSLNLEGREARNMTINWTGGIKRNDPSSRLVKLSLNNKYNEKNIELGFYTFDDLKMHKQKFNKEVFLKKFPYLKELKLKNYNNIDGIIGTDNPIIFKNIKTITKAEENSPIGFVKSLGDYVIYNNEPIVEKYQKNKYICNNTFYMYNLKILDEHEKAEFHQMEQSALSLLGHACNSRTLPTASRILHAPKAQIHHLLRFTSCIILDKERSKKRK